jgi:hypothetical protein
VLQHPSDTKVAQFYHAGLGNKDILALYVSVKNFAVMHMLHAQTNLSEPIEDLSLCKVSTPLLLDQLRKIATIGKVHNDAQVSFFGFVHFAESDDVWVIEYFQNLCLLYRLVLFPFRHLLNVDLFDNAVVPCGLGLHEEGFAESSFSEQFNLRVYFKLLGHFYN